MPFLTISKDSDLRFLLFSIILPGSQYGAEGLIDRIFMRFIDLEELHKWNGRF